MRRATEPAGLRGLRGVLALSLTLVASCNRTDPHLVPIEAGNSRRLKNWEENFADRFKREEWREFETALQELRLQVMAQREASGSAAVEEAMCTHVNGRNFHDVLVLGYEARLARLDPVRAETKRAVDANAMLVTKPGDSGSARYLEGLRERQEERVRKIDAEIEETERRLVELAGPTWAEKAAERKKTRTNPAPPVLAGSPARAEIINFIREQRDGALLKYGAWPVKLVTDEALLPEPERADFHARRAAVAATGNTVIAVRLRERWWIYDDRPELPTFPRAVMANLSERDRQELASTWANWQAELWARRSAHEQP